MRKIDPEIYYFKLIVKKFKKGKSYSAKIFRTDKKQNNNNKKYPDSIIPSANGQEIKVISL